MKTCGYNWNWRTCKTNAKSSRCVLLKWEGHERTPGLYDSNHPPAPTHSMGKFDGLTQTLKEPMATVKHFPIVLQAQMVSATSDKCIYSDLCTLRILVTVSALSTEIQIWLFRCGITGSIFIIIVIIIKTTSWVAEQLFRRSVLVLSLLLDAWKVYLWMLCNCLMKMNRIQGKHFSPWIWLLLPTWRLKKKINQPVKVLFKLVENYWNCGVGCKGL